MKCRIYRAGFILFYSFLGVIANAEEVKRCDQPAAILEVVEGKAEVRYEGADWLSVAEGAMFCYGDVVRITESRAALRLDNDTLIRLKEHSVVKLIEPDASFWVELLKGVAHFVSRTPKSFEVKAPYLNAAVDGTEFIVQASEQASKVYVVEGKVTVKNSHGQLPLLPHQAAVAYQASPPTLDPGAKLTDTVSWAFHYPVLSSLFAGVEERLQQLIGGGQYIYALELLSQTPSSITEVQRLDLQTALNLALGNVQAALKINGQSLQLAASSPEARSLFTLITLVQGDREKAVTRSLSDINQNPHNPTVLLTRSFVLQAQFKLSAALSAAQQASDLLPGDIGLQLRVAELALHVEDIPVAIQALDSAETINRHNGRLLSLRSVIDLKELRFKTARVRLEKAVELDSTEPLSQFLLGLTYIRLGQQRIGRQKIELAVLLDPNNSLYRSYLGKTYYDESRFNQATEQFELAKAMDPNDPTAYFYSAVQFQALGRPTQALREVEYSLKRNDNRAVYRSRLQLDSDYGARSASLADVYVNLGFTEQALQVAEQAKRSSNSEYGPFKIMADIYASQPYSGKAAASEYLQAQMRQPLSSLPMRPLLAEAGLEVLSGAGPSSLGLSEYNALMAKNENNILLSAAVGSEDSSSLDAMISGLSGRQSYLLESYSNQSQDLFGDGSIDYKINSLYYQVKPGSSVNVFLNLISKRFEKENERDSVAIETGRQDVKRVISGTDTDSLRLGVSYFPAANLGFYSTIRYSDRSGMKSDTNISALGTVDQETEILASTGDSKIVDVDLMASVRKGIFLGDIGVQRSEKRRDALGFYSYTYSDEEPDEISTPSSGDSVYTKYYAYVTADIHRWASLLVGLADITLDDEVTHKRKFENTAKKIGLHLKPADWLNINTAYFEDLASSLEVNQSLEPTQIFGITQVVDPASASESESLVLNINSSLHDWAFDIAASKQLVDIPKVGLETINSFDKRNITLRLGRVIDRFSIDLSVDATALDVMSLDDNLPVELNTTAVPLNVSFFGENGFSFNVKMARVFQNFRKNISSQGTSREASEVFSIIDLSVNYKIRAFTAKNAMFSLSVRNALDEEFSYESVRPLNNSGSESAFREQYAVGRVVVGSLRWLF